MAASRSETRAWSEARGCWAAGSGLAAPGAVEPSNSETPTAPAGTIPERVFQIFLPQRHQCHPITDYRTSPARLNLRMRILGTREERATSITTNADRRQIGPCSTSRSPVAPKIAPTAVAPAPIAPAAIAPTAIAPAPPPFATTTRSCCSALDLLGAATSETASRMAASRSETRAWSAARGCATCRVLAGRARRSRAEQQRHADRPGRSHVPPGSSDISAAATSDSPHRSTIGCRTRQAHPSIPNPHDAARRPRSSVRPNKCSSSVARNRPRGQTRFRPRHAGLHPAAARAQGGDSSAIRAKTGQSGSCAPGR